MSKRHGFFSVLVLLFLVGCGQGAKLIPSVSPTPGQAVHKLPSPTDAVIPTSTPIVVGPVVGGSAGTEGYPWWNNTVFYEIFVRSFYDSDGNGIGDFNGVTEKLDYLKDLGITGLWLLPIHPSPTPVGYNASDFYSVNPDYGSMDDFKYLLSETHKRGMRVLIDRVLYDTSTQNPWFIASEDPNSPYRDWYYWSATDQGPSIWGTPAWFKTPSGYYFSAFGQDFPFLNLNNPAVTAEVNKVSQFWLQDVGVDGFRVDSAAGLVPEGRTLSDTPSTHAWLKGFYTFYKGINPNAFTVGEVWKEPASSLATYTGDQVDTTFEFNIAGAIIDSVQSGSNAEINAALQQAFTLIPHQQFAPFITNHDMDRAMTMMNGDPEKAKAAASLLLTSPGVPFLYFGEEIGMQGKYKDANGGWLCLNTNYPMQWSSEKNAGFTVGSPWFWPDPNYVQVNVRDEMKDPSSLFSHYKTLISLRNAHPALRIGSLNIVLSSNPGLFASLRVSSNEAVLVLINLTNTPINNFSLSLNKSPLQSGEYLAQTLIGQGPVGNLNVISTGSFSNYVPISTIPAFATVIIQFNPK
jgi:glycosidase